VNQKNTCSAAILLLGSMPQTENGEIKQWFEKSRFLTGEATDIFQALEIISDFTMRKCPEVILLDIDSFADDFPFINKMVSAMTIDGEISILALSNSGKNIRNKNYFEGNFAEIRTQLDKILPEHRRSAAIAA
jgi:hypothetical protein